MIRVSCEHEVEPLERVWLKENDEVVCDDCHNDELHDDYYDRFDHGTAYLAAEVQTRYSPSVTHPKEAPSS